MANKRKKKYVPPQHYRILVREKKLGRKQAVGMCDDPPYKRIVNVLIDPRQNRLMKLDVLIHEHIHLFNPQMSETTVRKLGSYLAKAVWRAGYRKSAI